MDFASKQYDELLSYFLRANQDYREYVRSAPKSQMDNVRAAKGRDVRMVLNELRKRQSAD